MRTLPTLHPKTNRLPSNFIGRYANIRKIIRMWPQGLVLGHFRRDVSRLWSPDVARILLNRPNYEVELVPDTPQTLVAQIIARTVRRGLPPASGT